MVDVQFNLFGLDQATKVAADLRATSIKTGYQFGRITAMFTALLVSDIKRAAAGRPGPNVITGDYRRSWSYTITLGEDTFTGTAGTNSPQGLRLENGYVGTDALGRTYHQRPYPHVGPAFRKREREYLAALEKAVE